MGRWLLGLIILAIVAALYGFITAGPRIEAMEGDVRDALQEAGHTWANVDMSGNVATVTGTAPSAAAKADALRTAENAECSACNNKRRWHTVRDSIADAPVAQAPAIPTQSPYTFSARKTEDGRIVLNGYVPDEATRTRILADAREIFNGGTIIDQTIRVAKGAPDGQWADVIDEHFRELNIMTSGRFEMEDRSGAITGLAASEADQARILAMVEEDIPGRYDIAANIRVLGAETRASGEVQSQNICQNLLNDLREGKKIFFDQDKDNISGDASFDLLNEIAGAANQCPGFRVDVNGYASSEGDAAYNLNLSRDRANAVLAYLVNEGEVERTRIDATGYGEANPIASNDTAEGREQNRRIEFILSRAE